MEAVPDRWEKHRDYLKEAVVLKTDGNTAYKAKNFKTAIGKYHRALMMLKAVGFTVEIEFQLQPSRSLPQEMIEQRDQLTSECYNNLAACLLTRKDPDYQRVVEHCEKVLEHDPTNVKAAYRMGTALVHLNKLDKAEDIVTSQPGFQCDKTMQTLLKSIQDKQKVQDEKLKSTYQRMFQSDSKRRQTHTEPILIKNNASIDCSAGKVGMSPRNDAASPNGTKLIHVASAEKEAAC